MVVDSSALVELLRCTTVGRAVDVRIFQPGTTRHVHEVCSVEVFGAFRGLVRAGKESIARAESAIADLMTFPATRHPAHDLLPRAWQLRQNLTTYDALWVALAEVTEAPLVTCDAKFGTTTVGRLIDVEVIS